MTLLQLIAEFSRRHGLPVPPSVVNSMDDGTLQLQGKINEVLEDLTLESWSLLNKEAVWEQVGTEVQGTMEALAPFGYEGVILRSFFDRSQQLEVFGPLSEAEWQLHKATRVTGPYLQYMISAGKLHLSGALNPGHEMAFTYHSSWSVKDQSGTFKQLFSADTDTCLFPDKLLLAGLAWKWKSEKGLRYAEDFRRYETLKANIKGREGSQRAISMSDESTGFQPGVFVPQFSWKVQ